MSNQRYSTLDDIDTSNVAQLKGVWRTHLNGSGVAAKYSGESQPIVQDGVIYITTGNDDVFAVSVDSGKILWEHKSNIGQEISTICCGWLNRGVAIGDGRVYLGQLDGKVVALDPDTGGTLWTRQLVQWQQGQVITGAPLFLDGKIYIGVVGADYGTRGFLEAIDAETGDSVWRAYMVPDPGEPGSETWPQNSPAYLRGGASIWSTPAYDEDLNLLYVTTGNAGNDWFGGDREGDNLYAASIVAIDKDSGKIKWGFQEVHHDIWDYDSPCCAGPVRRREQRRHGEGDRRSPGRRAGSTSSTARPGSRSTGSTRSPSRRTRNRRPRRRSRSRGTASSSRTRRRPRRRSRG